MKIGLDISQIVYQGTGVGRFTAGLTEAILNFDKKNQWFFFFSGFRQKLNYKLKQKILERNYLLIERPVPPKLLSLLWNNLHSGFTSSLLNLKLLNQLDWFITSDWTEPLLKIKKATIVHDLAFLRYPTTVLKKIKETQKKRLSWVKKESKIIFADSQSTKDDLINLLNFEKEKIVVNYPGVNVNKPTKEEIKKTLLKYKLFGPFILTVGKLEPRKNLRRLIEAYEKSLIDDIKLVIVGPQGWENFPQLAIKKQENIKFLGYVSDNDLFALYSSCLFFIYPSIWEGFGYPIIEAMKLGATVVTSNHSSLKEISGDAAFFFDPFNIDSIQKSIQIVAHYQDLRNDLKKKGQKQASQYTWKKYYNRLISVLLFYK
ncbi:MAG: glycosyltransferase family 1 protein [Microgenomates group bacterium]|nr:glycosyltransferase family 1 protein [Microgenomates group bacterium]